MTATTQSRSTVSLVSFRGSKSTPAFLPTHNVSNSQPRPSLLSLLLRALSSFAA